jgi:hypothetical protein
LDIEYVSRRLRMKISLEIAKRGRVLHRGDYDVSDAQSLGSAVAAAWTDMHNRSLERTTSIGELMEALSDFSASDDDGVTFGLSKPEAR